MVKRYAQVIAIYNHYYNHYFILHPCICSLARCQEKVDRLIIIIMHIFMFAPKAGSLIESPMHAGSPFYYSTYWLKLFLLLYFLLRTNIVTVEPPIKDTIEITSEQRTRFNVPDGDFPIVLIIIFLTSNIIKDNLSTKDKVTWVPNVSIIRRFQFQGHNYI